MHKVHLAITPGEPAGIGPDLIVKLDLSQYCSTLIVVADPQLILERARALNVKSDKVHTMSQPLDIQPSALNILPVSLNTEVIPGNANPKNAQYVLDCLEIATALCESNTYQGLITGPINKAIINDAGTPFSGHTEWLAKRTGTKKVVMMLATSKLKVALATTHLPLREVADAIEFDSLLETIEIIHNSLATYFSIPDPRIAVCGLNPHAGENGYLGNEEITIITPVIKAAQSKHMRVSGPYPADTAFTQGNIESHDIVLAMYHDQGLPVLKHTGFGRAANITLGLPIVRTSVDHGTAFDLAGSGNIDTGSLHTAILIAEEMTRQNIKTNLK